MKRLCAASAVGLVLVLWAPVIARGQVPESESGAYAPHPEAQEAISRLKSPFCPGLMLEVCPSPQAAELRDSIQMLARGGMEADSIVEWMLANHGEEWRAVPRAQGTGIWAWVMPPAALVLGLGLVAVMLWKFRGRAPAGGGAPTKDISAQEEAKLERALREMEEAESEDALL